MQPSQWSGIVIPPHESGEKVIRSFLRIDERYKLPKIFGLLFVVLELVCEELQVKFDPFDFIFQSHCIKVLTRVLMCQLSENQLKF